MGHPNTVRGPLETEHQGLRDARETEYTEAKTALEEDYHADLAVLRTNRVNALVAAGFNPDGSVPPTFDTELPANTVAPAITGTPETGQTLTCSVGTWLRKDSHTFQWKRDGVAIGGATANTRVLVQADVGEDIKCTVTAHNESGNVAHDSNTVTALAPPP